MADEWDDDEWAEPEVGKKQAKGSSEEEESEDEEPVKAASKAASAKASSSSAPASSSPQEAPVDANVKVIAKDSMEELEINLLQHVDAMEKLVIPKIRDAKAKQATLKFLSEAVSRLSVKLTLTEAEQLHKTCKEFHTKRKKSELEAKKKKQEEEDRKKKEEMPQMEVADDDFFAGMM
mmetsp:Transcript_76990/g.152513  ORF Transcript_76990/g.152513 Transcript_76990/m.152513 type:complete len:178 (+) Transcript_76990:114-647(+)|eukprot:CAMPEP_0172707562 /NCGR_PEP_ID=MMETSP1074-20121228/50040_1 /TAXON_ID=2916 /ORGANISM="Ceratium fusus, Strain PA161109" /LENGTH=177 /DNA_ID=CAMNT_0013530387 /DNA_START=116 /DNA_END=649 /DNA_ORIENTATION=-